MTCATTLTAAELAERSGFSRQAAYKAIREGKIAAVAVAGPVLIAESEAERVLRDWPVLPDGKALAARWAEFRAWEAAQSGRAA
jgi:hypothetical protein